MYNGGEDLRAQLTADCRSHRYGVYYLEIPITTALGVDRPISGNIQFQRGEYFLWTGLVATSATSGGTVSTSTGEFKFTFSMDSGDTRSLPVFPENIFAALPNNYPDFTSYMLFSENDVLKFTATQQVNRNRWLQFTLFGIVYIR